jgi:hypothetical protein
MTYDLSTTWTVVLIIGIIWELIWKGIAMWRAARLDQPVWFTSMLLISSVGILPIIYLLSHHEYSHGSAAYKGAE